MNATFNFHVSTVRHFFLCRAHFIPAVDTISYNSVDGTDAWNIISCTYCFAQKPVPNLPCKHCWVRSLVVCDLVNNRTCCYLWLASTNNAGPDGASLVEPAQNLADTTMRNPQLPWDVTWPYTALSQLNNSLSNNIGKRSSIDEQPSELVNPAVSYEAVKVPLGCMFGFVLLLNTTFINYLVSWCEPFRGTGRSVCILPFQKSLRRFELSQALLNTVTGP